MHVKKKKCMRIFNATSTYNNLSTYISLMMTPTVLVGIDAPVVYQ